MAEIVLRRPALRLRENSKRRSVRFFGASILFAAGISTASDGLLYYAVYQCDADAINHEMVDVCSIEFPGLAPQANSALASWRERNAARASATAKKCVNDLAERSKTASPDEIAATNKVTADTKAKIFADFRARMRSEGKSACVEALNQLNQPGGPLDIRA